MKHGYASMWHAKRWGFRFGMGFFLMTHAVIASSSERPAANHQPPLTFFVPPTAHGSRLTAHLFSRMRPLLGTYVEIQVEGLSEERASRAMDAGFAAIEEVDRLLSSHRADSELNAINEAAGDRAISVSPWTYECIADAVEIGFQGDGAFDITCRPALDLWGFVRKEYRLPSPDELRRVVPLINNRNIILLKDPFPTRSGTLGRGGILRIGLARHGMKLDVGGIGKGFAVDKAVEALKVAGAESGMVRAGGDLRCFGPRPWRVGIADPSDPRRSIKVFEILNEAVSTSGDYENFFEVCGHRYAHIIDPRTGWPVEGVHSVSVRAPTCTQSDAWCKVFFVKPGFKVPVSIHLVDMR